MQPVLPATGQRKARTPHTAEGKSRGCSDLAPLRGGRALCAGSEFWQGNYGLVGGGPVDRRRNDVTSGR